MVSRASIPLAVILAAGCGSGTPVAGGVDALETAGGGSDTGSAGPDKLAYPPPGRQRLRGFFARGPELSAFQLCGSATLSWVEGEGSEPGFDWLGAALRPACQPPDIHTICPIQSAYVEIDATVSGPCQCGRGRRYLRQMRINEVFAAAPDAPPSCARAVYP
jgi:hypothetical protein